MRFSWTKISLLEARSYFGSRSICSRVSVRSIASIKKIKMKPPLVSVCIPLYNHERYIHDCLTSVIEQDYSNIELFVIDDGSVDGSHNKAIATLLDHSSRFYMVEILQQKNKGICQTLNLALKLSNGKYFSALASDDLWEKNKTRIQVDYLEQNPRAAGVFGGICIIDGNGAKRGKVAQSALMHYNFHDIFCGTYSAPAPSAMVRRDLIRKYDGYEDNYFEDWQLLLKLTETGEYTIDTLPEILASYRRHGSNISSNIEKIHNARCTIVEKYHKNKYYNEALRAAFLRSSIESSLISQYEALRYLKIAGLFPFSQKVFKTLFRALLPPVLNRQLSRYR